MLFLSSTRAANCGAERRLQRFRPSKSGSTTCQRDAIPRPCFQKDPRKAWQRFCSDGSRSSCADPQRSPHTSHQPGHTSMLLFPHLSVRLSVNWTKKSCACICNHLEQMSPSRCRCKRRCKWNASHSPTEVSSAPVRTRACLHTITETGSHSAYIVSHGFAFFGHRYLVGLMSISMASYEKHAPPRSIPPIHLRSPSCTEVTTIT